MKKTLALLVIVSSILLVGCGSKEAETEVGGKPALPADPNAPAPKKGSEPAAPMTAPAGVKTGTPGG